MKTSRLLGVIATLVLLLCVAGPSHAQTFAIQIPDRTASYFPTGEVKITLQMSGDPGAGSTLKVSWPPALGNQTVSLSPSPQFLSSPADEIVFNQQAATNTLVI